MPANILIVGAGAVGAFYASRLAQVSNLRISVICRSNYKAVAANGFSVTSPKYGEYRFTPTHTFPNPDAARKKTSEIQWDYVVVSTKALPDVTDDSQMLEGLVGPSTAIVLIQNGLGVEEPYAHRFPNSTILSAVTIVSAAQPEHGHIAHNRWTRISIGPYLPHLDAGNAAPSSQRAEADERATQQNAAFMQYLQDGGVGDAEAYGHAKLQLLRWHKVAINAAMNPSAVLSGGTPNGSMANDAELAEHLRGVMDEVLRTAPEVLGQPLPREFATPEQILRSTQRNTTGSKPSMLLDWEQGKTMELEVILGNPIRKARAHGLEMPRLQALYALLRMAQENRQRAETQSSKL